MIIFKFTNRPSRGDTTIMQTISSQVGICIVMINRAYLALLEHVAINHPDTRDLKPILPEYFREQEVLMAADRNPFEAFLHSDYVVFPLCGSVHTKVFVPAVTFWRIYKQYCQDNSIRYNRPGSDITQVLRQYNVEPLTSRTGTPRVYRTYPRELKPPNHSQEGERKKAQSYYLVGIDVAARFCYAGRNFPTDTFCINSRLFNAHVDYQGKVDDADVIDGEVKDDEPEWDIDVFLQHYDDHVAPGMYVAGSPSLKFPQGDAAAIAFYKEAMQHINEILEGLSEEETHEVHALFAGMVKCLPMIACL